MSLSVLHVAAMFRARQAKAQARFKDKKVVKDSDGKDMTVYEYSDAQVARRNSDKAKRIQKLRGLRTSLVKQVKKDLKSKDLKTKLTALAVALIDHTYERVGNEGSAEEGHFGVTGWQAQHVKFSGNKATVSYVGKSGVKQSKKVTDAAAVSLLREVTKGKSGTDPIFACEDGKGGEVCITAKEVNEYLPEGVTAKDLRGLHANQEMLDRLKVVRGKGPKLPTDRKAKDKILKAEFKKALAETAAAVGHEPSTLKSQYLVPKLEDEYMKDGTVLSTLDGKTAAVDWKARARGHEREVQNIKRRLKQRYGGVFDEYLGIDAKEANKLRKALEEHRVAYGAALSGALPTKQEIQAALSKLGPGVQKAATKTHAEKEEEQTRKMLRKEPKLKPPRQDLRKHRLEDDEDVEEKPNAENDKDLSRNYKKIAAVYLAKQVAKSEEAAKKLFEQYKEKSPDTDKTWEDFFEKGEDEAKAEDEPGKEQAKAEDDESGKAKGKGEDKPKGKKPKGEKSPEDKAKAEEQAKVVAHRQAVKDTMGKVKETLSKIEGVSLPGSLRKELTSALEDMSPEQVAAFTEQFGQYAEAVKTTAMDGPAAVKNAERALEDLKRYDFGGALDPAELAQKVVEQAHAETVVKRDQAKQTGKERLITDTMSELESKIQDLSGDKKYLLPKEVKTTLTEQMKGLGDEQIAAFAQGVASGLEERAQEDMDSVDAVDEARDALAGAEDAIAEMDNPEAKAGAVADLIHARRVLERSEGRGKAKAQAEKAALASTASTFGERKLPSDVQSKLQDALAKIPADKIPDYLEAMKVEAQAIRDQMQPDPETGETEIPGSLIGDTLAAMRLPDFSGTPQEVGQQVARAMAAQSLIADPFEIAGTKVGETKDAAARIQRGRQAFDKYKELPTELQVAAAKKIQSRLESLDAESDEAQELDKILDGITLAALVSERALGEGGKAGAIPQIPGREVNAGFAEMARAMAKDGKIDMLLGPVEDFYSAEGQLAVQSAMQGMTDEALAQSVQSVMPDAARYLLGDKGADGEYTPVLSQAKKVLLRNSLIDMSIDQMSVMDRVLKGKLEDLGDERFDDPEYREEKMKSVRKRVQKSKGDDWWAKLLSKWFAPDTQNKSKPSGVGGKSASLLSVWKFANSDLDKLDPGTAMRLEMLQSLNEGMRAEFGKGTGKGEESHSERALRLFLETKNPEFLRSKPETPEENASETASEETETAQGKKEGRFSRFSLDIGHVYTARQPSVCAESPLFAPRRGTEMTTLMSKEAAQTAVKCAGLLDAAASAIQSNFQVVGLPQKIALDFAYRCDLLSDALDTSLKAAADAAGVSKEAYTQGPLMGGPPTGDDNTNAGPPQPMNPKIIGEQDVTPPITNPDEAGYMRKNFIQEEFNELRHFQEDGLFSNAKAASEVLARMEAKIAGMRHALSLAVAE